jgi:hypothetical protein
MDKLYLGQENEKDVDDLLAQLNDASILKMSVNTHKGTNGMQAPFLEDQKLGKEGIDPDLEARYASLKAPRPKPKEKGATAGKSKHHGDSDVASSPQRPSKGASHVERSSSGGSDGGDSLDAELLARLQALKGPSVSSQVVLKIFCLFICSCNGKGWWSSFKVMYAVNCWSFVKAGSFFSILQMPEGEETSKPSSGSNTPTLSEHLQALKSRPKKSPQRSPSRSDYPAGMTVSSTSVGSAGWCAPTSPFKLMKVWSFFYVDIQQGDFQISSSLVLYVF